MDNFSIAQIVGVLVTVSAILSTQFRNMKWILIWQIISNLLLSVNLALLGGLSGAGICITATVQTVTVFIFNRRNKKFPLFLTILFSVTYAVCSAYTFKSVYDVLPCIAAIIYALSIIQEKSSLYRVYMIANSLLWVVYDFTVGAYTTILTYVFLLVSIGIAIYRHDLDDWKNFFSKNKKSGENK